MLSREEKEELLRLSRSPQLRRDFRIVRKNREQFFMKKGKVDIDKYIKFLTAANAFINHSLKPFRKIEGNNFKL